MSNKVQFDNLSEAESYIRKLEEEIEILKQKLRLVSRISECHSPKAQDGPIVCIMGYNTVLGRCHSGSLEKKIVEGWYKGPPLYASQLNTAAPHTVQPSEFPLQTHEPQDLAKKLSITAKVEYFYQFCVDSLGLPVVELNGCYLPLYQPPIFYQIWDSVVWPDTTKEDKGRKCGSSKSCWNCSSPDHDFRSCPHPKNYAKINANRTPNTNNGRYHRPNDERFTFKPGNPSDKLLSALGLKRGDIPEYIYNMRQLGYPPGYKLVGRNWSGMAVYSDRESGDVLKNMQRDQDEEVLYPGYNAPQNKSYKASTTKTWNDMEISDEELEEGEIGGSREPSRLGESGSFPVLSVASGSEQEAEDDYVPPPKVFAMDFPPAVLQQMSPGDSTVPRRWKSIKGILKRRQKPTNFTQI